MAYEWSGNYEFPHTRTYDGDLGFLIKMYNQLKGEYDSIKETVDALNSALQNLPSTINAEVARQLAIEMQLVYKILDTYDTRIETAENTVNSLLDKVNALNNTVLELTKQLAAVLGFIETYTDMIGEKVYRQLKELVEAWSKDLPPVTCPVDGNLEPISKALQDIYDFYNRGITAEEYDALEITAEVYASMNITAHEYDAFGRDVFYDWLYCSMISPFTGQIALISTVVNMLADFHKNGITAAEYDALGISASDYDNKNISAYDYDWNNPLLA